MNVPNVLLWVWMLFDWNKVACTWFNPWKACRSKFTPNLTNQSLACQNGLQSQNSLRNMCLDWPNDILHVINLLLDTIYHYRELVWEFDMTFTRPRVVAFLWNAFAWSQIWSEVPEWILCVRIVSATCTGGLMGNGETWSSYSALRCLIDCRSIVFWGVRFYRLYFIHIASFTSLQCIWWAVNWLH